MSGWSPSRGLVLTCIAVLKLMLVEANREEHESKPSGNAAGLLGILHFNEFMKFGIVSVVVILIGSCVIGMCVGLLCKKAFNAATEDPLWVTKKQSQALPNGYQIISRGAVAKKI
eukprot:CAMPEP_0114515052 /NCGR_PEP_ID=MMETSP0109-20121206/16504_1 /TAXON_ID=29199 /ORGANISM="Chlorarachnion reptans, Strain CCCM449" /LENGTH=114 /DNA_ID=CAMNT_0001695179 /DNA_START=128 /DNA_END=472 /DNA_ORIENTATION=+